MKLKLPIFLLTAIFAIQAQAATPYHTTERINIAADASVKTSQDSTLANTLNSAAFAGSTNATPKVIVKDGQGELVIDTNTTMSNPFVVREGTTTIQNATVQNNMGLSGGVSNLVVGGNNASLQLDNASYTQSIANGNPHGAITIGTQDGKGSVKLSNGSTLHTDHCAYIGYPDNSSPGFYPATTTEPGSSALYTGGTAGRSSVVIDSNSSMSVGQSFYTGDADITVTNGGQLTDNTLSTIFSSYIGMADNGTSNINVTDGGKINFNNGMQTGGGDNSTANINVSGAGSELNLKGDSWLGIGVYDWGTGAYNAANSSTIINATDGATINTDGAICVGYNDAAQITVDANSSIKATGTGGAVYIYEEGTVTNSGTIEAYTAVAGGTLNTTDGSTMGDVVVYSGTMNVSGTLTMTGDLIVEDGAALTLSNGAKIEMGENTITLSDDASIAVDVSAASANTSERVGLGKYLVVDATSMAETLGSEWDRDAIAVSTASSGNTAWVGNKLYLYTRSNEVDAVLASAWGVFKSSQAFTGTLWAGKTQAANLSAAQPDGKGGLANGNLAWASLYADGSRLSNQGSATGADYSLFGAAVGVEHRFVTGRNLGAAFGYDWGKSSAFGCDNADQESTHVAVYGRPGYWNVGKGAVAVDCAATVGSTTTEYAGLPDWDQDNLQLDTRVSYIRPISDRTSVSGFVGAQYYAQDSANVDGAKLSSVQNLRLSAGAGASHRINRTTVFGEIALHNDTMRHNPHLSVDNVSFQASNPGRFGGSIQAGATHQMNQNWNVFGSYTFEAAENHVDNRINVGVSRSF